MRRTISAVEARQKLGEVLEGVHYRGDEVLIERAGKPMAAIVPVQVYQSYLRQRERAFALIERIWEHNKDVDPAIIEAEVAEAVEAVRKEDREALKHKASA